MSYPHLQLVTTSAGAGGFHSAITARRGEPENRHSRPPATSRSDSCTARPAPRPLDGGLETAPWAGHLIPIGGLGVHALNLAPGRPRSPFPRFFADQDSWPWLPDALSRGTFGPGQGPDATTWLETGCPTKDPARHPRPGGDFPGSGVTPRWLRPGGGRGELKPQDYSTRTTYRPPAAWYQRLNWLGVRLTSLGLAPRDAVTLASTRPHLG